MLIIVMLIVAHYLAVLALIIDIVHQTLVVEVVLEGELTLHRHHLQVEVVVQGMLILVIPPRVIIYRLVLKRAWNLTVV
jgi:hypothetical protein